MRLCEKMVEQICSRYGDLLELWFDGGVPTPEQGGPDLLPIVNRYQSSIVYYHSDERRDHRWIGNEEGVAGYPCWATCASIREARGQGVPGGPVWSPAMCDVPLRDHKWFWNPGQEDCLESLDALMNMYYKSVGRNCSLIIGGVPNREGLLDDVDVERMKEFGREIERRFGTPIASTSGNGPVVELELPEPQRIDHVSIMERISRGERIREYVVEGLGEGGAWKKLCDGLSVGHKRIQRFEPQRIARLRLRVTKSAATPLIRDLSAY
jgi:alpha-L-fucosidase